MRVIITDFAKQEIRKTASHIQHSFGKASKDNFLNNIRLTMNLIGSHPFLGPEEESLADLPGNYRSIVVNSLNKMIYRIQDDHVLVEDFWDVRREPSDLKGQIIRKR